MSVSSDSVIQQRTGADVGTSSLMTTWAEGWTVTRDRPSPDVTPYGRYINVGRPEQVGRHVVAEGAEALVPTLAASITASHIFIKAFGTPAVIGAMLPLNWAVEAAVWLMTTELNATRDKGLASADYIAAVSGERAISVELRDLAGELGATGRAAVVGRWCIFDQIVTVEAHRRRGLGSAVMRLIGREAELRGAEAGLLVATDDGRALYERLGWSLKGAVTSAVLR